jgi:hypothetical protein
VVASSSSSAAVGAALSISASWNARNSARDAFCCSSAASGSRSAQRGGGDERAVDERAAASLRRDFAAHDHFPAERLEYGLDGSGVFTGANEVRAGASADEQPDGADENRFAGAGLSRQHGEAGSEFDVQPIDDGQIAYAEKADHRIRDQGSGTRIGNAKYHRIKPLTLVEAHVTLTRSALSQRRTDLAGDRITLERAITVQGGGSVCVCLDL